MLSINKGLGSCSKNEQLYYLFDLSFQSFSSFRYNAYIGLISFMTEENWAISIAKY